MILLSNTEHKYKSNSHFVFCCNYHVVFTPKYRRSVLSDDISKRLKEIFYSISEEINVDLIELEIMPDHVHMVVNCDPSFGITKTIRILKGKSAKLLRSEFPSLKKRLPCLWTRSSFIATVGSVSLEVVKRYVKNQKGK